MVKREKMKWVEKYDRWYEENFGKRAFQEETDLMKSFLPSKGKILEVGTGTGRFASWLEKEGYEVVGIDISFPMLKFARENKRVKYLIQGDAQKLPFKEKSFDGVIFITSLEYIQNPIQALKEAYRVSRGIIFLGVLNSWSILGISRRIKGLFSQSYCSFGTFYNPLSLKRLAKIAMDNQKFILKKIYWKTVLYPLLFPKLRFLPFGGFIGMKISFGGER